MTSVSPRINEKGRGGDLAGAECEVVSGGLVHVHTPCAETDSKQFLLDLYCIPFEIFDLVKGGALGETLHDIVYIILVGYALSMLWKQSYTLIILYKHKYYYCIVL